MKPIKDILRSYAQFDEKGRHVNGCDKQSNHNYGDAYEQLFFDHKEKLIKVTDNRYDIVPERISIRHRIELMMEVGVADGSCLLAWTEIFPNATIVGMDIHPCSRAKESDRIEFHIGNQCSRKDCERVAGGRLFDFILEDATHQLPNTLLTLFWLWPYVKPGGIYVVEEWENASSDRQRIKDLWPNVEIIGTCGPYIKDEPLIVLRKPL